MTLAIRLTGCLLVFLAAVHLVFPRYFGWKKDLAPLSLINRQMMEVHTFFIGLTVFLMGLLCLVAAPELVGTHLGGTVCTGLSLFWAARLVIQVAWYSPQLWKGKAFETSVHIVFVLLWSAMTILFARAAFLGFSASPF